MHEFIKKLYKKYISKKVRNLYFRELIEKTGNFDNVTWLGNPIWQNILDLWVIQETISEIKPKLLIECGTNRGGSSMFYAQLFDLLGQGEIITIDVEKLHDLSHPRITYLLGSSTEDGIVKQVQDRVDQCDGPILVILDSDHSESHVYEELKRYNRMVTKGSYCLVQDGCIDQIKAFSAGRPGPLPAIERFLRETNDYVIDEEKCDKFMITQHPKGWLKKVK